ncbi:MAG: SDR family NAD(P)-dependent oxidoreductase [Anaerolineae bacterium]|jgi:2-hydroxycyclohexanecarboxyl-CoA dehydrogenase
MPTGMHGQVAIITGGGAGIGKACSLRFAQEGAKVVVFGRAQADGEAVCAQIRVAGGEAISVVGSVQVEADCQRAAQVALDAYGRIDALVANAGARVRGPILESTDADWDLIVGVNLKGVAYCCKAVLPTMIARHAGAIVVVSSANALVGRGGMGLYDATKAGELALVRTLAVEHAADGVRVNAILPGYTYTDYHERAAATRGITPEQLRANTGPYALLGRPAEPTEIAAAIYFMASPDAANITGQHLLVDGGLSVTSGIH